MSRIRRWLILAAALVACGCGDRKKELRDLDGREFIAESVEGRELVPGSEIRMSFQGGSVSVHAGCNSLFGMYSIEDGVLHVDGVGSTAIGCDLARLTQDEWVSELLTDRPTVELDGPRLTMTSHEVELVLLDREMASPDRPLVGTHWIGNGVGDENVVGFGPGGDQVTVDFDVDDTVAVFTSCKLGTGEFTADADTIEFESIDYMVGIDCSSGPAGPSLDMQVTFVLDGSPVGYEIEERNLTIRRAGKLLFFRADE